MMSGARQECEECLTKLILIEIQLIKDSSVSFVSSFGGDKKLGFFDVSSTGERQGLPIKMTFSEGLIIFATDAATAVHSPLSELTKPAQSSEQLSDARRELLRYIENVVSTLYSDSQIAQDDYSEILKSQINRITMVGLVMFILEAAICWVLVILASRNIAKVQTSNLQMVALFSNIRKEDVNKVRDRCSSFFVAHLAEYFDSPVSEILQIHTKEENWKKSSPKPLRNQQDLKLNTEAKDNRRLT